MSEGVNEECGEGWAPLLGHPIHSAIAVLALLKPGDVVKKNTRVGEGEGGDSEKGPPSGREGRRAVLGLEGDFLQHLTTGACADPAQCVA